MATELDVAEEVLNKIKNRAIGAKHGVLDNDMPIAELREAFELRCSQNLRPSTVKRYKQSLNAILSGLNAINVSQFTVDKVMKFRQQRLARVTPRAVNHDTTVLGAMLNWAVKTNKIASNPLKGLEPLLHDNPKNRRPLGDHEVKLLLIVRDPHATSCRSEGPPAWGPYKPESGCQGEVETQQGARVREHSEHPAVGEELAPEVPCMPQKGGN